MYGSESKEIMSDLSNNINTTTYQSSTATLTDSKEKGCDNSPSVVDSIPSDILAILMLSLHLFPQQLLLNSQS